MLLKYISDIIGDVILCVSCSILVDSIISCFELPPLGTTETILLMTLITL